MADGGAGDLIRDGLFRQLGYLDNLGVINLNELAGALGNDANFATSVATAIGNARTDWGYATTIGNASATSIVVTHNLASRDVVVEHGLTKPWYVTELGINDRGTSPAEKGRRYAEFVTRADPQIAGVVYYHLELAGAVDLNYQIAPAGDLGFHRAYYP